MQSRNRIFDDFARVAGGAAGTLSELREEIENVVRTRVERVADDFNLVSREEFDAVKAVATKARAEQEKLEKRVTELESQLKKISAAKSATKRTAPKAASKK